MKNIAKLACRILSIVVFIYFLNLVSQIFMIIKSLDIQDILYIIMPLLLLIVSVLLWICADKLAGFMVGKKAEMQMPSVNIKLLHPVAFSVVGLILISVSLPKIVMSSVSILTLGFELASITMQGVLFITFIVELIIGVILLFGAKRISRRLERFTF